MESYEKKNQPQQQQVPQEFTSYKRKDLNTNIESNNAKKQLVGNVFFPPDFNAAEFASEHFAYCVSI